MLESYKIHYINLRHTEPARPWGNIEPKSEREVKLRGKPAFGGAFLHDMNVHS